MKNKRWIDWIDDFFERRKGTILIVFVLFVVGSALCGYLTAYFMRFNGIVEKLEIKYPKHQEFFTINGKRYEYWDISPVNANDTLAVGDSAVKKAGTTKFIIYKRRKSN